MALALTIKTEEIAHDDQLEVWAEEMTFAIMGWLKEPESYDDKVQLARAIKDECRKIVEITLERARHALSER